VADVQIDDLSIHLGNVAIIERLNLHVQSGEFLVLLGPSGCGKSTLLHSIAGFIEPTAGCISIGGSDVTWADPKDRGIGMVFQSYALYPTMTVEKNMAFGPRIAGMPKAQVAERVQRVATMLHLTELLQRKPAQLSGGQRQRVAIGRALVRQAQVLLFDEPLSNLDAKLRATLRRELKELHATLGTTMIYVTHDQVEAMTLASRIAVMKAGAIQQIDAPAVVYGQPANLYVAGFLGAPAMNTARGRLEANTAGDGLRFVHPLLEIDVSGYRFAGDTPAVGRDVVIGIRPEDIAVHRQPVAGALAARVRLVEPMGASQVLWLTVGNGAGPTLDMGVIAEPGLVAEADSTLYWLPNTARISLFDAVSEQRL